MKVYCVEGFVGDRPVTDVFLCGTAADAIIRAYAKRPYGKYRTSYVWEAEWELVAMLQESSAEPKSSSTTATESAQNPTENAAIDQRRVRTASFDDSRASLTASAFADSMPFRHSINSRKPWSSRSSLWRSICASKNNSTGDKSGCNLGIKSSFDSIAAFLSCAAVCVVLALVLLAAGYRIPGLAAVATGSILSTGAAMLCVRDTLRIAKEAKEDEKRFRRIQAEIRAEIERISGGSK